MLGTKSLLGLRIWTAEFVNAYAQVFRLELRRAAGDALQDCIVDEHELSLRRHARRTGKRRRIEVMERSRV